MVTIIVFIIKALSLVMLLGGAISTIMDPSFDDNDKLFTVAMALLISMGVLL